MSSNPVLGYSYIKVKKHRGKKKGRTSTTFTNKCKKIEKWYNHMVKNRQEKNRKGNLKKQLLPIEYFIDKVKKSNS